MRRSQTQQLNVGECEMDEAMQGAPSGGGRIAGLAQWQSSLDSWLSSALLSSSQDAVGPVSVRI